MSEPRESFGDVAGEYLALVRGAGIVSSGRELVWAHGADVYQFLESLLSQAVDGAAVGTVRRSLLLAPSGKLRANLHLLFGDQSIGLVVDRGAGKIVLEDLTRFKIRTDVILEMDNREMIEVWGPKTHRVLLAAGIAPSEGWSREPFVAAVPFALDTLPRYLLGEELVPQLLDAGAVLAGSQASEAVRIELGEPLVCRDLDAKTIPQEAGLIAGTVDFSKGCYLGQELVARIESRGRVNRHLRGLVLRDNVLPPLGAELVAEGKVVGLLTSLAESFDLRAPVGLALIRREVEAGDEIDICWSGNSAVAAVHELPLR